MGVSGVVRGVRAGVFAAVCVLLAAAGHGAATGDMPPLWADAAGFGGVFALGCALGGRERSLPGIGAVVLGTQAALHLGFDGAARAADRAARPHTRPRAAHGFPAHLAAHATGPDLLGAHATGVHALTAQAAGPHLLAAHATGAHLCAALAVSWWLRRGEAAVWSVLRRAATLVPVLSAWWRRVPPPVSAGRAAPLVPAATGPPCGAPLRHAVRRRGPPPPVPYRNRPPAHVTRTEIHSLMSTTRTALRRAGAGTALAAAAVLLAATAASAHVTVHPESYPKGATDGVLTFRVPNEEDAAATTKVQVFLPTDHPCSASWSTRRTAGLPRSPPAS